RRRVDKVEGGVDRGRHALQRLVHVDLAELLPQRGSAEGGNGKSEIGIAKVASLHGLAVGIPKSQARWTLMSTSLTESCAFPRFLLVQLAQNRPSPGK